jgi:hypothetical protein
MGWERKQRRFGGIRPDRPRNIPKNICLCGEKFLTPAALQRHQEECQILSDKTDIEQNGDKD